MRDTLSKREGLTDLCRMQLKDALEQLNSATLSVQKILEDYRSRVIPSPHGDYGLRQALKTESRARLAYMRVAMILHDLALHGKVPTEGGPKVKG
jgi:hypothetical protein